jgi:hypothetical protein
MGLRAAAAARTLPVLMRTPARRSLVVVLALALAVPAGAGFAQASGGTAAAKKCKRGYVPKKVRGKRKCVRKKAATPSGTINFNGKNAAGGFLRFGIAGGKLSVLSSLAPRKCTLYSDGSVVADTQKFPYTVGSASGRGAANSFKVSSSGSFSGEFSTGTLGAGGSGVKLTLSGRSSGGKLTGSFRILSSYPTNGCDSGLVKF